MNNAVKTAFNCSHTAPISLRAAFFHSTHVSERKRKTHWYSGETAFGSKRFNNFSKRVRRREARRTLLRNVGAYAEHLFQGWKTGDDGYNQTPNEGPSWFREEDWVNGKKKNRSRPQFHWESYRTGRKGYQFCISDDEEVETIFQAAFGGARFFYCSFNSEDSFQWRNSSNWNNQRTTWSWKSRLGDEYDTSTDYNSSKSDLASDRLALGLSASGPLKLQDVKSAYRACALKWHPDRHQGSSKVHAEEKFKQCSAAYQTLCDRLSIA